MPSATGSSWEKYKKEFADDEEPEKKIKPLTDESVGVWVLKSSNICLTENHQRYTGAQDLRRGSVCCGPEEAGKADQREADKCQ